MEPVGATEGACSSAKPLAESKSSTCEDPPRSRHKSSAEPKLNNSEDHSRSNIKLLVEPKVSNSEERTRLSTKPFADPKSTKPSGDPKSTKPSADSKSIKPSAELKSTKSSADPKSIKPSADPKSVKPSAEPKSSNPEIRSRPKSKSTKPKSSSSEERARLLGSSSESRPGYGGIGVSFAEQSESFPSPDFKMSTEDKDAAEEEEVQRKLKYFFMNPLDKWYTKRKFPWKLLLQVVKIFFVTLQLVVFGSDGYLYELQRQNTVSSFRHMLFKDWTSLRDVLAYPPSTGPYAVYTKTDFFVNVDNVIKTYADIKNIALGTYCYDGPNCTMTAVSFCRNEYNQMVEFNSSVTFDGEERTICHDIPNLYPEGDPRWNTFSIKNYLAQQNDSISFDLLVTAKISFTLKTIFLKRFDKMKYPDCYSFKINVQYNNLYHDGQVLISLESETHKIRCFYIGPPNTTNQSAYIARQVINGFIISICALSLLLCCRCLAKAYYLCRLTDKHFRATQNEGLYTNEKLEFLDMWYCIIIFTDVLIIGASCLKTAIELQSVESDQYATCAILLGVGNFLVWAGILRYLGFFSKYNILILTMKRAIPNVLRFTLCCILLYSGFVFCGWVVLGPYHIKFRSLSSTSECLFAMMNGDDLFATFAITNTNNNLIWWFSRVYLYTFISMFIYVVISLFISVIMDSYETVKDYYRLGGTMSRIQVFVADYPDDSCSSFYQQRRRERRHQSLLQFIMTFLRNIRVPA